MSATEELDDELLEKQINRIQEQTDRIKRNDALIFSLVGFVTGFVVCLAFM